MRQVVLYDFMTATGTHIIGGWLYGANCSWRCVTPRDGLTTIEHGDSYG